MLASVRKADFMVEGGLITSTDLVTSTSGFKVGDRKSPQNRHNTWSRIYSSPVSKVSREKSGMVFD